MKRLVFSVLPPSRSLATYPFTLRILGRSGAVICKTGVAPAGAYPNKWSEDRGIKWSIDLTGTGGSTPVVADGKLY